ncbi:hypothetical protein LQV05_006493 [Cryptococcus neoformans]|nr:hypothetical protein LQV05_006493 [Cryptococcus neoformans]
MSEEKFVTSIVTIPKLTGFRDFVRWRRALLAYLDERGIGRTIEGCDPEPLRKEGKEYRPTGERAGLRMAEGNDATEQNPSAAKKASWEEWQKRESKARAAILLSVSEAIVTEIEDLADTDSRKNDIVYQLTHTLPENSSSEAMQSHIDTFQKLIAEAKAKAADKAVQPAHIAALAAEAALASATVPTGDEPATIEEAMDSPERDKWHQAVESELNTLKSKGTWSEVSQVPDGRKLVGCKWVFKRKLDADGNVAKYKARLVAQGFFQQPGLDYEATFAPVSRSTTFRLLMTIAATYDLELHQADVEGAYLNGDLDRDIFMRVPKGYTPQNPGTTALKLNKTIYGLKQSGREWWKVLGAGLEEIGFKRCESEWGLYVLNGRNGPEVLLLVYVDDLVIAAKNLAQVEDILAKLSTRWTLSHLGPIDHVLGMKIKHDS